MKRLPYGPRKAPIEKQLFRFANSHYIVTRDPVSLSCATTPYLSCFTKS